MQHMTKLELYDRQVKLIKDTRRFFHTQLEDYDPYYDISDLLETYLLDITTPLLKKYVGTKAIYLGREVEITNISYSYGAYMYTAKSEDGQRYYAIRSRELTIIG